MNRVELKEKAKEMIKGNKWFILKPAVIIASIGLYYYKEVCADNPEMKATEIVKKSWAMTKGHKMDLFVLILSFIGWAILAGLIIGILYIRLYPYMLITITLAYEELKKAA